MNWDVFISHASEDKDAIARPLATRLTEMGLKVWFDEFSLSLGDSLRRSIDRGLSLSKFGVVIVSPHFLEKEWPQRELDGLVAREIDGVKVILPVWHEVDRTFVCKASPTLADKLAVSTEKGLATVADSICRAIRGARTTSPGETGVVGAAIVYCSNCGARAGRSSNCPGRSSHNFVSTKERAVHCSSCGASPGIPSSCPGRASHSFVSTSRGTTYCSYCGAAAGRASNCYGRASHNFVSTDRSATYCSNCGATPGLASNCPGRASHSFVSV